MKTLSKTLILTAVIAVLAGCSNSKTDAGAAGMNGTGAQGMSAGQNFTGQNINGEDSGANMVALTPEQSAAIAALPKTVYFGFDKYELNAESKEKLSKTLQFLINNPSVPLLIAGNTDPRGSQDYNFHLGERRADAVKDYYLSQGVPASQLCTVSYGELRPAAQPSDFAGNMEKAYSLDRRSDLNFGQICTGQGH